MPESLNEHFAGKHIEKRIKVIGILVIVFSCILGASLVMLPDAFHAQASGAKITVSPQSGAYSNQKSIQVSGSNFGATETVKIYWNYSGPGTGTLETSPTTSATGTFSAHFPMPLVPTGTYTVAAVGQTSGLVATGTTRILPEMYMSPRAAGAGTLAYFFGFAFGSGENVKIYWNYTGPGTGQLLTSVNADTTGGSFKVTAKIPTNATTGTIPVGAVGQTSNTSASFGFIYYPPLFTLAPLSGSAGTVLTVSGYGFTAFEKVNVFWNNSTTAAASASTNANGYIAPLAFTIPAGVAPGNYAVKAVGVKSQTVITNTFKVLAPGTTLNNTRGPVGSRLAVSGVGYKPGEQVNILWNYTGPGTGSVVATASAGNSGIVNASFLIPANTPGNYTVALVGTSSQAVSSHVFTINNSVAVDPTITSPGTNITISGTGYQASETVQIYLDTPSGNPLATTEADSSGNISTSASLSTSIPPGTHSIIGVGQTSGQSFTSSLAIDTNWGDFGFDPIHHRYNPYEYGVGTGNVSGLSLKWSASTTSGLRSSPVYANGMIYVGSYDGILTAYDAHTGSVKWVFNTQTGFEIPSAPLVDPVANLVFIGTMGFEDSGIPSPSFALDATTGALKWSIILPWNNFGFPSLGFNTIYIGASHEGGSAMINALDEFTGQLRWQHATTGGDWGAIAIDTSTNAVFSGVGNPADQVISLNASTGALNWAFSVPNSGPDDDVGSGITVYNGLVYATSKNGRLYALHESDGTLAWSTSIGPANIGNVSSPTIGPNGTLYVGSLDANLYAINAMTGAIVWKAPTGGGIDSSPAIANGIVYFSSFDKNVYAVNASTGAVLWHYTMGKMSYASPVIVNGWLYSAATDGKVYAFSL